MTNTKRHKLTRVPQEIRRRTGRPGPTYRALWTAVVNGEIPAEQGPNGQWTIADEHLDDVAAAFDDGAPQAAA
jgi:hypothetical protein